MSVKGAGAGAAKKAFRQSTALLFAPSHLENPTGIAARIVGLHNDTLRKLQKLAAGACVASTWGAPGNHGDVWVVRGLHLRDEASDE
jgi:hypothetical protein